MIAVRCPYGLCDSTGYIEMLSLSAKKICSVWTQEIAQSLSFNTAKLN